MKTLAQVLKEGREEQEAIQAKYKYVSVNRNHKQAMQLQSVGWVLGTPAGELKDGDMTMWNFGSIQQIVSVDRETPSMVVCTVRSIESGNIYKEVKYKKTRLICVLKK